jgi:cytokinin riboside 5'-monophosphate phosphoribohydrolase
MRGGRMSTRVCVYCSSSDRVHGVHMRDARILGEAIAERGWELVFGGADVGVMGTLARSVKAGGGRVTGVLPQAISDRGLAYAAADELIVTRGLRERKERMESLADAFVALAGGFGTLEETLEIITLKQLGLHNKAIAIVNTAGFYDSLMELFQKMYKESFAKPTFGSIYFCASDVEKALAYLESYRPGKIESKWF